MKAIVTGGAGMVGSALVRRLLGEYHEVAIVDDFSRGSREALPEGPYPYREPAVVQMDLAREFSCLRPFYQPADVVFHLAARVGGVNYMLQNEVVNLRNLVVDWNVIESACTWDVPLLYTSTACVYPTRLQTREAEEGREGLLLHEEDALHDDGAQPESIYGWAKLTTELALARMVQETGHLANIVRMFNVYGPWEIPHPETGHAIPALIYKALTQPPPLQVWGSGQQRRAFTFVSDAVEGILAVHRKGRPGVPYNIGTPESVTILDLARLILRTVLVEVFDYKAGVSVKDVDTAVVRNGMIQLLPEMPTGVHGRAACIDRAKLELNWEPQVSLAQGLSTTVAWCKEYLEGHGVRVGEHAERWKELL